MHIFTRSMLFTTHLCLTLRDATDCSTSGSSVFRCLPEFAQIHVHCVGDATHHLILCCPLLLCLQSFPASGSFPMSCPFASDGQSIGASATVLPVNIQDWFPLGLTGLISLLSKGLSRVVFSTTVWKHQFFGTQPSLWYNCYILHDYQKNHGFDYTDLCQQNDVCFLILCCICWKL